MEKKGLKKPDEGRYSLFMGFVYVSNLIVGTGALTMPLGVAKECASSIDLIFAVKTGYSIV